MSLMFDGSERDTLIINKNVYKFDHIWGAINMNGANVQNTKYRGSNLGAFTEDYAAEIYSGDFDSMQVGDTFIQNGHTYKIAGFNYLCGADNNSQLGNHLIMITDSLGNYAMNPSDTTNGGFVGSAMWQSHFPTFVNQLKADFGKHLLTWNEFLTTGTDGNAANQGQYFAVQASMMNATMYWGQPGQYSVPSGDKNYNIGIETKQLPIMQLHPDEQTNGGNWTWQRDVRNGQGFAGSDSGRQGWHYATILGSIRAFFLID